MGNAPSLYGTIGYTYLKTTVNDINNPKFILVLSDNHSKLPYCDNYEMISDWLKNKTDKNNVLLEEVPRNGSHLKELFGQSDHTQRLKHLFINNPKLIKGIDIRPMLIQFSWELLELMEIPEITFKSYLEDIDSFFNFNNDSIRKLNEWYNKDHILKSQCYRHFKIIKDIYVKYKYKYYYYLGATVSYIFSSNKVILEELNGILDHIMEFYTALNIFKKNGKNAIIHTGLMHSEKLIYWLTTIYPYKIIEEKGITAVTKIDTETNITGCLDLSPYIDNQLS